MAYSNIESKNKSSFFIRLKNKFSKILIKNFPLNNVRILGVKMCGYKVGKKVYIGEEFLIVNTVSENSTSLEIQDLVSIAPRVTVVLSSDPNWSHLSKIYNPIKGKIIHKFGKKRPDTGIKWKGIFIKANEGDPVYAVAKGKVVFSDWLRGFGNIIIIDHGGNYMSLYGNNESLLKKQNDMIRGGDQIATVGNSGGNSSNGLYYELRKNSKPFNPLAWTNLK